MFFKKLFSIKLDDYFFNFLFVCLFSTKEQQNYKTEKKKRAFKFNGMPLEHMS